LSRLTTAAPLILASASAARARLLVAAGLDPIREAAAIDEAEVKRAMRADGANAGDVAETLAELKAQRIAPRHPATALVVAADQMLVLPPPAAQTGEAETWFDKPADRAEAARQLRQLRGRTHELISAVVVFRDGRRAWHAVERARMSMRPVSDAFLEGYLDTVGDAALASVGGYQLEGPGAQLFDRVQGDFFTVLGLPLLPLLAYLRQSGDLAA
jgi:septum formation protein